jgi:hypothetical protein
VAGLGVPPHRLEALAILLVGALRANPPAPPLRAGEEAALRDAGRLVARWAAGGAAGAAHEPVRWSALVTGHDRPRAATAVLHLRAYLPYPCPPGVRAVVEVPRRPGKRRECWVGNRPTVMPSPRSGPRSPHSAPRKGPETEHNITVYWPSPVERDLYRLADLAPTGTLVIRDRFTAAADGGDRSGHSAFVAGTAASAAEDSARLRQAGVAAERIVVASIG